MDLRVWPGRPYPLGANWDGMGVNFALFSEQATKVELCLFDSADATAETQRIPVTEQTHQVWHCYLPDVKPGQLYGYRVDGPYEPKKGQRFNANKLLLDPYAKAIGRDLRWHDSLYGYQVNQSDLTFDNRDSAAYAPLAVVTEPAFTWGDDRPPRTPWHKTIIYEMHVKGFTKRNQRIPANLRGTYAGLASSEAIRHLRELGVTAVELLPVHYHADERFLTDRGLVNYWGYNTLSFFAPDPRYAALGSGSAIYEFKSMVRALHAAGLEVILDVVYNHTAEGNEFGPTLSLRGIDNWVYYRLNKDGRTYVDFTGCGNSLNVQHPHVLQLIMDSLRYWILEMHVDGFRFDLASSLARGLFEVDKLGAFFDLIHQDPVVSQVKLIAEPWDVGSGGYQVGNFPVLWTEWNGNYRDCVRRFWNCDGGRVSEFATRLAGSSDLYQDDGRQPTASINFITCHDGFTLQDLVSYDHKHNEANKQDNRDGWDDNQSCNFGVEGPTDDSAVKRLRAQQKRNLLATLLLSQGVPMLLAGDELSHTQNGNNNAYCQDNEISWLNWELNAEQEDFLRFVRLLLRIRQEHPVFRRRRFLQGRPIHGSGIKDIYWLTPRGTEMSNSDWNAKEIHCLGMGLFGNQIREPNEHGEPIVDQSFLVLFNTNPEEIMFKIGGRAVNMDWELLFDTGKSGSERQHLQNVREYQLQGRSLVLLRLLTGLDLIQKLMRAIALSDPQATELLAELDQVMESKRRETGE